MQLDIGNLSGLIHFAIAPAMLLVGIGTQLRVFINRLARIIDRAREVEERLAEEEEEAVAGGPPSASRQLGDAEMAMLRRRTDAIYRAIWLASGSAALIGMVIAGIFVDRVLVLGLGRPIGALFVLAMLSLAGSFACFLHEIRVATDWLRLTVGRQLRDPELS